jgi:hypothetical protein
MIKPSIGIGEREPAHMELIRIQIGMEAAIDNEIPKLPRFHKIEGETPGGTLENEDLINEIQKN